MATNGYMGDDVVRPSCTSAYMAPSPWENPLIPYQPLVVPAPNVTLVTAPDPRIDGLLTTLAALVAEVQRLAGLIEKKGKTRAKRSRS